MGSGPEAHSRRKQAVPPSDPMSEIEISRGYRCGVVVL